MINKDKFLNKYPLYVILAFFNWMLYTSMPFLGNIRQYFIIFEIILVIPIALSKKSIKHSICINIPLLIFLACCIVSSIFTSSLFNPNLWMTILIMFTVLEFLEDYDEAKTAKLIGGIYVSINVIMTLSLIGILLVQFTDLENSTIEIISYSLGNFVQFGRFLGVLNSPNTLGPLAAIAACMAIIRIRDNYKDKKILISNLLALMMNLYILVGTKSLTSIGGFCIAIGVMCILSVKRHRKLLIAILVIAAVLCITLFIVNIDYLSEITNRPLRTMSERTIIWSSAMTLLKEHPIVGYGALENFVNIATERGLYIHPNGTHNMFIETSMLYGIPATILFISALILTIYRILKCYFLGINMTDECIIIPVMAFAFTMLQNLMEAQMMFSRTPTQVVFLFFFILANVNLDNELKAKESDKD